MSHLQTSDLHTRIAIWTESVTSASSQQELQDSTLSRRTRSKSHPRAPLLPTSSNRRTRKRDNCDQVQGHTLPAKRRKGTMADKSAKGQADLHDRKYPSRDRKPTVKAREGRDVEQDAQKEVASRSKIPTKYGQGTQSKPRSSRQTPPFGPSMMAPDVDLNHNPSQLNERQRLLPSDVASLSNADERDRPLPSPSKRPGSPSKVSRNTASPTKNKRDRTRERPKNDKSLTMQDLGSCSPSIRIENIRDLLASSQCREGLPPLVDSLRMQLQKATGFVPQILQSRYDQELNTPKKTRSTLPEQIFQNTFATNPHQAERLQKRVAYVMRNADWNFKESAHERQWSIGVVTPIINDVVECYMESAMIMNLEDCSILPVDIRPVRHNGISINDDDVRTDPATVATDDSTAESTTSRMIDLGIGLVLSFDEQRTVQRYFRSVLDGEKSLNQTLSYPVSIPLFLDLELKKTNSERQPEVQLGVWQAAGFLKRQYEGWNEESMPMPGICINGHVWTYYITFQVKADDDVIMIGPFHMGDTKTIGGIWEIMYKLDVILRWGTTEYKQWFDRVVLSQMTTAKV